MNATTATPTLGPPRHVFDAPRAKLSIWFPTDAVVLQRVEGYADLSVAEAIARHLGAHLERGFSLAIFDDFEQLTGYDSDARLSLTAWTKQNAARIRTIDILVRSKLVAMGVSVANLALGGNIRSHSVRARFEAALSAACRV